MFCKLGKGTRTLHLHQIPCKPAGPPGAGLVLRSARGAGRSHLAPRWDRYRKLTRCERSLRRRLRSGQTPEDALEQAARPPSEESRDRGAQALPPVKTRRQLPTDLVERRQRAARVSVRQKHRRLEQAHGPAGRYQRLRLRESSRRRGCFSAQLFTTSQRVHQRLSGLPVQPSEGQQQAWVSGRFSRRCLASYLLPREQTARPCPLRGLHLHTHWVPLGARSPELRGGREGSA